jgi:hypothetical protein
VGDENVAVPVVDLVTVNVVGVGVPATIYEPLYAVVVVIPVIVTA